MTPQAIFNRLPGAWTFTRTLQSDYPVTALAGTVQGVATIVRDHHEELHYQEQGRWFTAAGSSYAITRDYRYIYDAEAAQLVKYAYSPQGEPHYLYSLAMATPPISLGDVIATGQLVCNQDHYRATYVFSEGADFNQFCLTYDVTGPKKVYRAATLFKRV